jgi:GMP synthase-like glutamine amidotransferase
VPPVGGARESDSLADLMASKPGLILQHGPSGSTGLLGEWFEREGIEYEVVPVWEATELPDPAPHRFVASLGAIESVRDTESGWVPGELDLLRRAVAADVPVLGLCFGGQALSAVLGGGVDALAKPEVGWLEVRPMVEWVPRGPWLYYHNEALRTPPAAQQLADGEAGPSAFSAGPHLGVQFHPEATPAIVDVWARKDPHLSEAGTTPEELAAEGARVAEAAREAAFRLFAGWWERGPGPRS